VLQVGLVLPIEMLRKAIVIGNVQVLW